MPIWVEFFCEERWVVLPILTLMPQTTRYHPGRCHFGVLITHKPSQVIENSSNFWTGRDGRKFSTTDLTKSGPRARWWHHFLKRASPSGRKRQSAIANNKENHFKRSRVNASYNVPYLNVLSVKRLSQTENYPRLKIVKIAWDSHLRPLELLQIFPKIKTKKCWKQLITNLRICNLIRITNQWHKLQCECQCAASADDQADVGLWNAIFHRAGSAPCCRSRLRVDLRLSLEDRLPPCRRHQ